MPVFQIKDYYVVQNRVYFEYPEVSNEIGHISTELAIFVDALMQEKLMKQHDPGFSGIKAIFETPSMLDFASRAKLSGQRRQPPLVEPDGVTLTPLGEQYAPMLAYVLKAIEEKSGTNTGYASLNPNLWVKADDAFLSLALPTRCVHLLRALQRAIDLTTEQQHAIIEQGNEIPPPKEVIKSPKAKPKDNSGLFRTEDFNTNIPLDEFLPITFPLPDRQFEVWCPTVALNPTSRSDVRYLQRYGLVDTRVWRVRGPGRARHVIRVSHPGRLLLKET